MTESAQARPGRTIMIDSALGRQAGAELLGTALLVFFGAGMATVSFGYRAFGSSIVAGIGVTALTFALVLIALVALIGPVSGCHVNPAVTLGAVLTRRMPVVDAIGYWVAQIIGGILGALLLLWVMHSSPFYSKSRIGLGANGWGSASLLHATWWGAFLIEVIITAVFVMVVLAATRKEASPAAAAGIIGLALGLMNLAGIPVDGASVNPARSLGPAVVVGGQALNQVWLFLVAPLVGAVVAAGLYVLMFLGASAAGGMMRLGGLRAEPVASPSAAGGPARPGSSGSSAYDPRADTGQDVGSGSGPGQADSGGGEGGPGTPPQDGG